MDRALNNGEIELSVFLKVCCFTPTYDKLLFDIDYQLGGTQAIAKTIHDDCIDAKDS